MFKEVRNQIATILGTITGSTKPLKAVYKYVEPSPMQYPSAMIFVSDGQEIRLDTASNFLTMQFTIRVLIREKNTEAAEDIRLDLMTNVVAVFRSTANVDTLAGLVEKLDVVSINPLNANEDQPVFGFDLVLQASKIKMIS